MSMTNISTTDHTDLQPAPWLTLFSETALLRRLFRSPTFAVGFSIVALLVLAATIGVWFSPYQPNSMDLTARLAAPNPQHWFGTDNFGRDIFTRVAVGSQMSLLVGLLVVVITGIGGALLGALAGYVRALDNIIMRVMDAF